MKSFWNKAGIAVCLLFLVLIMSGCWPFPDPVIKTVTGQSTDKNVYVSAPETALDSGAGITVSQSSVEQQGWFSIIPVSTSFKVEPTKGSLHGTATMTFSYDPKKLPKDVTPGDLLVSAFNPTVNAWIPVPAKVDDNKHQLIVTTAHFSDWKVSAISPGSVKEAVGFAGDIGKDAALNHGDIAKAWFSRVYSPTPELDCNPKTTKLTYNVNDILATPYEEAVCEQATNDPDVIELKIINTHFYPVWVNPPQGVEIEPFYADIHEADQLEEVLTQIRSSIETNQGFLLNGKHEVTLKVHLSKLQLGAKIRLQLEADSLLANMGFFLLDMAVAQKDSKWGKILEKLKNVGEKKEVIDSLTSCFTSAAVALQKKYKNPDEMQGDAGKKKIEEDINAALDHCADPTAKAAHGLWNKVWGVTTDVAKDAEGTFDPIGTMIHRFRVLWDNPQVITQWVEGLTAAITPNHGGSTIDLSINHNPLADVDFTKKEISGIDCITSPAPNLGVEVDEKRFADVTGDGKEEAFVAVACVTSTSSWPDRLEVFDGASDPTHPRRIATLLDYQDGTDERGLRIGSNFGIPQSITISGRTVTVVSLGYAPTDPNASLSQQITDTFTWNGSGFTRGPRSVVQAKAP